MALSFCNLIAANEVAEKDIEQIFSLAQIYKEKKSVKNQKSLMNGLLLGSIFFEPSTRTKTTFELASKKLSARKNTNVKLR